MVILQYLWNIYGVSMEYLRNIYGMMIDVGKTMSLLPPIFLGMVSLYMFIPSVKMLMTGAWCKWHCFTRIVPPIYQNIKTGQSLMMG